MVPIWSDSENGVRVVRLTDPAEIEMLVRIFERVADMEGWKPDGALRLWLDRSVYFALEANGQIVGGLQLVLPALSQKLPCQTLWPEVPVFPANRCAHVAILALEQSSRGHVLLFWRLVIEMWRYCVGQEITTLFIEVTPRVLPIYRRLGWPLQTRGELRFHWGEDCYLCTLGIPEVAESLLRKAENSPYYQQIISQAFRLTLKPREGKTPDIVKEAAAAYFVC